MNMHEIRALELKIEQLEKNLNIAALVDVAMLKNIEELVSACYLIPGPIASAKLGSIQSNINKLKEAFKYAEPATDNMSSRGQSDSEDMPDRRSARFEGDSEQTKA